MIVRLRWLILLAVAALAGVSFIYTSRLSFNSSIEGWFLEDDPNIKAYGEFLERFVGDEFSVIGVFADDVFDPQVMAAVDRLTRAASKVPHAHRVRSLANAKIFDNQDDALEIRPLVRKLPRTAAESRGLRDQALDNPLLNGTIVSQDAQATAIVVELASGPQLMKRKVAQAQALERLILEEELRAAGAVGSGRAAPYKLRLTGTPALDKAFYDYNERDFNLMLPVSTAVVLLIAFLIFRHPFLTIIPPLVVGLGVLMTFGLMGAMGIKVNILSSMVAALIMAVGVADAVHVLADYRRNLLLLHRDPERSSPALTAAGGVPRRLRATSTRPPRSGPATTMSRRSIVENPCEEVMTQGVHRAVAIQRTIVDLFIPCLFTTITTAAGFLSLLFCDLQPIREAGWLAAVGVVLAFLLSMTLIPALLSFMKIEPARLESGRLNTLVNGLAARMSNLSRAANMKVLIISAAMVVVVILRLVLGGVEVGANPIEYFRKGDPVRSATEEVDARLGGSTSIELTIKAPNEGLKDPAVLRKLDSFQKWAEELPSVSRALSIVDYLKELNRVVHGGDRRFYTLPASREAIAQYYILLEGEEDFSSMVQENYSLGRMTARVRFSGSGELSRKLPLVEAKLARDLNGPDVQASLTGFVKLMGDMEGYLVRTQLRSMLIAFCVISVMMFILLRSVRLGLFAMIPNLVPILLGLGFMTFVGIGLDPGTVMIGSIALGLVVDDTVHFLVQFRRQRDKDQPLGTAISGAIQISGQPIINTSIILVAGFMVATLGSFNPNVNFGLISAVVIVLALIADLVMLPAALRIFRPELRGVSLWRSWGRAIVSCRGSSTWAAAAARIAGRRSPRGRTPRPSPSDPVPPRSRR